MPRKITFICNYTYTHTGLQAALDAIARSALGSLDWVESRPLAEGARALEDIHLNNTETPKIVSLP